MTPADVRTLARDLMDQHGLEDWDLTLGTAKRVYGTCYHRTQTIKISKSLAAINPESETRATILHEIAHALAGPGHGHDSYWKSVARSIGANPARCHTAETPESPWLRVCPNSVCEFTMKRYRKTTKRGACPDCCTKYNGGKFSPEWELVWVANPSYVR